MHEITSCQRLEESAELAEYETDYGVHSICENYHYLTTQESRLAKGCLTPPAALAIRHISPIAATLRAQVFTWNGPGTGVNYGNGRASMI